MRRILSITAIVALIASPMLPLLAESCPHVKPVSACHRTDLHAHHCDMMHDHGTAADAESSGSPESDGPACSASQVSHSCSMDCCATGQRTKAIAAPTAFLACPFVITDHCPGLVSVVFASAGFSSHTDRGPPTA
jgi:hypothetical protein